MATSKRYPTEGNKRAYKSARYIGVSKLRNAEVDFFVNVGKRLAENIKSDSDPLQYIINNVYSINTIEVTDDKLLNIISATKNSASSFDELPAFIMKQCSKLYVQPLFHVLSLSIRQ